MKYQIFAVIALAMVFGLAQVFLVGLTGDTAIFMQQSLVLWRHPETMYSWLIQVNPPFNIMVYAPFAAFAAAGHLPPALVLHGFAFCVCVCSILSINHALKYHGVACEERGVWSAAAAFLLLIVSPGFAVFADREHLLFAFALPWIIQMLLRLRPLPYTALLAAFGFCMRPFNILLFVMLSLLGGPKEWTLFQRLFSKSSLIIAASMGAYLLSVMFFFPSYLARTVPMAALIYHAHQLSTVEKLRQAYLYLTLTLLLLLGFIKSQRIVWYGFIFSIVVIFFLNGGWLYTYYPLMVAIALIAVTAWLSPSEKARVRRIFSTILCAIILIMACFDLKQDIVLTRETGVAVWHRSVPLALTADLRSAAGAQFILLSTTLWNIDIEPFDGEPRSVFGYDVLWPFSWLYRHGDDPRFSEVLHFVTDSLIQALKEFPGAPVILDVSPELDANAGGVSVRGMLERDPRVKSMLAAYSRDKIIDYCKPRVQKACRFEVWRRKS